MQTISSSGCNSSLWLGSPVATSPPCALQDLSCLFFCGDDIITKRQTYCEGYKCSFEGFVCYRTWNVEVRGNSCVERISSHSWRRIQSYNLRGQAWTRCDFSECEYLLPVHWPQRLRCLLPVGHMFVWCVKTVNACACLRVCVCVRVSSLVLNVIFLSAGVVWWNFREKKSRKKVGQEPMVLCLRSDWAWRQTSKNFSGKKMGAVKESKRVWKH